MNTARITAACPCRACARLAGVTIMRAAEEARFAAAHTQARPQPLAAEEFRLGSTTRMADDSPWRRLEVRS